MGKLTRQKVTELEKIGEEAMFDKILDGQTVRSIIAEFGCGWRVWQAWIKSVPGRHERYQEALRDSGHAYAARAVDTAQLATPETANLARLQIDTDKWIASKRLAEYDVRQREVSVTVKVEDLHAQAAALIAQEAEMHTIDGNYEDVSDGYDSEGDDDA
jgi:hypothetical protein